MGVCINTHPMCIYRASNLSRAWHTKLSERWSAAGKQIRPYQMVG